MANINWQGSGFKEPCIISTDVYFNTSGNKPAVYRRDKPHFFNSFLWNKNDKIKRTLFISNYDHCRLKDGRFKFFQ